MFGAPIRNVMNAKQLLIASPDTTVGQAAKLMATRKMSAVMVVDGDGRLVGIFTERDAVHRVIARALEPDVTRLADVMTPDPKTVAPRDVRLRAAADARAGLPPHAGGRGRPAGRNGVGAQCA